jgi:hypothetical protein
MYKWTNTQMHKYTKQPNRKKEFATHLNGLLNFYREPLVKSIELHIESGRTLTWIKNNVFDGEISEQAISQTYLKGGKKNG